MRVLTVVRVSPRFTLSLWRPFAPETEVLTTDPASQLDVRMHAAEGTRPKVRVFQWSMLDDPLGGVEAPAERTRLQALFESLRLDVDPSHRTIDRLGPLLDLARQVLASDGVVWSHTQAPQESGEGETRLNALLALANQIAWLLEVYRDLPNTWVSIK